jgi:hypothetical protein
MQIEPDKKAAIREQQKIDGRKAWQDYLDEPGKAAAKTARLRAARLAAEKAKADEPQKSRSK